MADFSLRISGITQNDLETEKAGQESCQHCENLRSFMERAGSFGGVNGFSSLREGLAQMSHPKNYPPEETECCPEEQNSYDVTDSVPREAAMLLQATVTDGCVEHHEATSPVLRRDCRIPEKYFDRFMSLSLYSGKDMAKEIETIIERLKDTEMTEKDIEDYLKGKELDSRSGQTSDINIITCGGEKFKSGLKIYTRTSRTLKGLRHIIRGTDDCDLAKDLGLKENDMLLMINSECVTEWPHKQVVDCLSKSLKHGEHIAMVIFRDLPGKNNNIYLTVRGQVNIVISRGEEPIEVVIVNPLTQEIGNCVVGLKKEYVLPPYFIWQHEIMDDTAQFSLSINTQGELYMDVSHVDNEKAYWIIHQFGGNLYAFENGFPTNLDDVEGAANHHKIWLIQNKETNHYIAVNHGKDIYLSSEGELRTPSSQDVMQIDERMLLAHRPPGLGDTYLFESLKINNHFLCIDKTDPHRIDLVDQTGDEQIKRFAFQMSPVAEVIKPRGNMETITRFSPTSLRGSQGNECEPVDCLPHMTEQFGGLHFGRHEEHVFSREEVIPREEVISFSATLLEGEVQEDDIPSGFGRVQWPPANGDNDGDDAPVLRRAGMYRFLPPQESKAEKEGVAVAGQVRNMRDMFEKSPSSRASCAVRTGHVEILSKMFKV